MDKIFTKEHIAKYIAEQKTIIKDKVQKGHFNYNVIIVQVGDNPASNKYVNGKINDCKEVGIHTTLIKCSENTSFEEFRELINRLGNHQHYYQACTKMIIQKPLPKHLEDHFNDIIEIIADDMDIDGFKNTSLFKPCTPKGIIDYLNYCDIDLAGKHCVVVGRSDLVGKPLAQMLIDQNATVTLCHSKTRDLKEVTKQADILITAIGKAKTFDRNYISDKTLVVDVGINVDENGKLCGDVDYNDVIDKCAACTPVPCGVGLLTRLAFLQNVIQRF